MTGLLLLAFTGFIIGMTAVVIPGPLLFFTIAETMRSDARTGLRVSLGHIVIEVGMMALIVLGLASFVENRTVAVVLTTMGGVGLSAFGAVMIATARRFKVPDPAEANNSRYGAFVGGMAFSALNPSFPLWWIAVGAPAFQMALVTRGWPGLAFFVVGHWGADVGWLVLTSWAVHRGRRLVSERNYRYLMVILGALLVCFGGFFFATLAFPGLVGRAS